MRSEVSLDASKNCLRDEKCVIWGIWQVPPVEYAGVVVLPNRGPRSRVGPS